MSVNIASDVFTDSLRNYLPFLLMVALNISMCRRFVSLKIRLDTAGHNKLNRRDFQFTVGVISMNFIFAAFYTPLSIAYIIQDAYKYILPSTSPFMASVNMFWNITVTISYIYNSIKFFIFLSFYKLFRREVCDLLFLSKNKISRTKNPTIATL